MSKKLLWALVIMALSVIVLIFNTSKERVSVDLLFTQVNYLKSIVLLVFMGIGVAIGVLLK